MPLAGGNSHKKPPCRPHIFIFVIKEQRECVCVCGTSISPVILCFSVRVTDAAKNSWRRAFIGRVPRVVALLRPALININKKEIRACVPRKGISFRAISPVPRAAFVYINIDSFIARPKEGATLFFGGNRSRMHLMRRRMFVRDKPE